MANTIVTDKKIEWLVKGGYIIKQVTDGVTSYFVTEKGKAYLNGKEE